MMVSIPCWYHLIVIDTFRCLQVLLHTFNITIVFAYWHNPNFTICELLDTFENCKQRMSHFTCWSIARLTTSFILVNVFLLFVESVYSQTYSAFRHHVYIIHILYSLVYSRCRKILCYEKMYRSVYYTFTWHSFKRKFYVYLTVECVVLNQFLQNFTHTVV